MANSPPTATLVIHRDKLTIPSVDIVSRLPSGKESSVRLGLAPIVVGSDPNEADLVVSESSVSRRHCRVQLTERGIRIEDLKSKNGTFLEDALLADATLPVTAVLSLAKVVRISFREVGAPTDHLLSKGVTFGEALGGSAAMRALFAYLEKASTSDETLLLLGESGTGKDVLARGVHAASRRKAGPFVPFDCGAVSPSLAESELFGHVKGAFTGAVNARSGAFGEAHGGTLFLDEIGELPPDLQPKLLRALESRQYQPVGSNQWISFDARIIAATHRDLQAGVRTGMFRQDLYYRLAVLSARVPPLRERADDVELLTERMLGAMSPPREISELPSHVLEMLRAHDWPGNVRELKNTVTRLVLFPEMLSDAFDSFGDSKSTAKTSPDGLFNLPLKEAREQVVEEFERKYIEGRLRQHHGNISETASAMNVSRQFLHRLISRYGIQARSADS